jgi:hypothetical protein
MDVPYRSRIARDGPNLLFVSPDEPSCIFLLPSGSVQNHQLKLKGDDRLFTIKVTSGAWIAELTRHLDDGTGNVFSLYALDPDTGVPLREYFFPRDLGYEWGAPMGTNSPS